ncbi:MAG: helix-turn-helix domain-containing protein [Treponema sp.]|jgi:excisionase family DNA binding protein|nr:helix-turn-helix domain-containing protein [Treponema sp.]
MDKLPLTLRQICDKYQISRSTIDRWRKEGLPDEKLGGRLRFNEKKVDKWIKENKS